MRRAGLAFFSCVLMAACGGDGSGAAAPGSAPSSVTTPQLTAGPSTQGQSTAVAAGGGSAATKAPTACSLLTAAQIQSALGGAPGAGSETDAPDGSETICGWTLTKADGSGFGLELHLYAGRSSADWSQQRQSSSAPTMTVTGLGDDAFSETVNHGGTFDDLWVKKGSLNFRVEVLQDLGSDPLKPLAQAVLAKV